MITEKQYIEDLLSTPINYTCSKLSEHLEGVSHDSVTKLSVAVFTAVILLSIISVTVAFDVR